MKTVGINWLEPLRDKAGEIITRPSLKDKPFWPYSKEEFDLIREAEAWERVAWVKVGKERRLQAIAKAIQSKSAQERLRYAGDSLLKGVRPHD